MSNIEWARRNDGNCGNGRHLIRLPAFKDISDEIGRRLLDEGGRIQLEISTRTVHVRLFSSPGLRKWDRKPLYTCERCIGQLDLLMTMTTEQAQPWMATFDQKVFGILKETETEAGTDSQVES